MTFRMEKGSDADLCAFMSEYVQKYGIDARSLVSSKELPVFEKYDRFVPGELLRYAYSVDKLNADETAKRICDIAAEY